MTDALDHMRKAVRVLRAYEEALVALTIQNGGTLRVDTRANKRAPHAQFSMTMSDGVAMFRVLRAN